MGGADEEVAAVSSLAAGLLVCRLEGSLGPSLTSVAIVLSRSPPKRFRTSRFLSLSPKPMSLS